MKQGPPVLFTEEIPKPQEYCALRVECGLSPKAVDAAAAGLPRSLFALCLRDQNGILIGMGRIVGDGLHVQVVDIAVSSRFQKRGLSRQILERLRHFIDTQISSSATVSLFADVDWLYQKFGFYLPKSSNGMFYARATNSKN